MEDQDRQRKVADDLRVAVQMQLKGQAEAKLQAPKDKKKLFPNSALFKEWGENLSEEEQREAEALFKKYGYNVFLSDRLPLDRPLADTREPRYNHPQFCLHQRSVCFLATSAQKMQPFFCVLSRCSEKSYPKELPTLSVVLIYLNEALSVIKRALRSIIDRTPKHLLKEVIMVDDNSSNGGFIGHKRSDSENQWAIKPKLTGDLHLPQHGTKTKMFCLNSHIRFLFNVRRAKKTHGHLFRMEFQRCKFKKVKKKSSAGGPFIAGLWRFPCNIHPAM